MSSIVSRLPWITRSMLSTMAPNRLPNPSSSDAVTVNVYSFFRRRVHDTIGIRVLRPLRCAQNDYDAFMAGLGLIGAILRRPWLWGESLRAAAAMAPRAWWRSAPRLPLPDPDYMEWRLATAYGSSDGPMQTPDVVAYLEWRRRFRRVTTRGEVAGG